MKKLAFAALIGVACHPSAPDPSTAAGGHAPPPLEEPLIDVGHLRPLTPPAFVTPQGLVGVAPALLAAWRAGAVDPNTPAPEQLDDLSDLLRPVVVVPDAWRARVQAAADAPIRRWRVVRVDVAAAVQALAARPHGARVRLFPDRSVVIHPTDFHLGADGLTWRGLFDGDPASPVELTVVGDAVVTTGALDGDAVRVVRLSDDAFAIVQLEGPEATRCDAAP